MNNKNFTFRLSLKMTNNYNLIAPIYTFLNKLVFLGCIQKSQIAFLSQLPSKGEVLFIGGGSGETLKKIVQEHPDLKIDYIDKSEKMISLSREKLIHFPNHHVNFIIGNEQAITKDKYDIIMTFYYLDLFGPEKLDDIHALLSNKLRTGGIWLISDFSTAKNWWQKTIEFFMFSFLKITTSIESKEIAEYRKSHFSKGFQKLNLRFFYGKYIFAASYLKI